MISNIYINKIDILSASLYIKIGVQTSTTDLTNRVQALPTISIKNMQICISFINFIKKISDANFVIKKLLTLESLKLFCDRNKFYETLHNHLLRTLTNFSFLH